MTEGVLIDKGRIESAGKTGEVVLIPIKEIDIKLEADVITPDSFAGKNAEEIGNLRVWQLKP